VPEDDPIAVDGGEPEQAGFPGGQSRCQKAEKETEETGAHGER
jgi:hypothetical protein